MPPTLLRTVFGSRLAYHITRCALAILFIYSGGSKLPDPRVFADRISDFGILPEPAVHACAIVLIALELAAGIGLAFDLLVGLALVSGLLVAFSGALAYGIALGLDIDCGCFGPARLAPGDGTLAGALGRNLVLLALCGYLCWFRTRGLRSPRRAADSTQHGYDE